jgi:hypothetical protein
MQTSSTNTHPQQAGPFMIAPPPKSPYSNFGIAPPPATSLQQPMQQANTNALGGMGQSQSQTGQMGQQQKQGIDKYASLL